MRALSAMVLLAICALLVIIYQAIQQELNIRNLKTRVSISTEQVKMKESAIMEAKMKVDEINKKLTPLMTQRDHLKKQRDDNRKSAAASEKEFISCKGDKVKLEKESMETKDSLQKLKQDQESERKKAEGEIVGLKQRIFERDSTICKFVDLNMDEAKKLCSALQL